MGRYPDEMMMFAAKYTLEFTDRIESNFLLGRESLKFNSRIETVAYTPEQFEDWIPLVLEIKQYGVELN